MSKKNMQVSIGVSSSWLRLHSERQELIVAVCILIWLDFVGVLEAWEIIVAFSLYDIFN